MEVKVSENKVWIEGDVGETLAFIKFPEIGPGQVAVTHTIVGAYLKGQGFAGKLVLLMAEKLRADHRKARLSCPYAVHWFAQHPEYHDVLVDPVSEMSKPEAQPDACMPPRDTGGPRI